jgi:hypothetical protein
MQRKEKSKEAKKQRKAKPMESQRPTTKTGENEGKYNQSWRRQGAAYQAISTGDGYSWFYVIFYIDVWRFVFYLTYAILPCL